MDEARRPIVAMTLKTLLAKRGKQQPTAADICDAVDAHFYHEWLSRRDWNDTVEKLKEQNAELERRIAALEQKG